MQVSYYIATIKDWMIRSLIERYLRARELFLRYSRNFHSGTLMPFENIMEISDALFQIKEDNYLIFRRLLDPKRRTFEDAPKLTPTEAEIRFMNNVGLLFHKVMVARELKYVLEHYPARTEDYDETLASLEYHLQRIEELFEEGLEIIREMIANYRDNAVLLMFFVENRERIEEIFGLPLAEFLKPMVNGSTEHEAAFRVAEYYLESGWLERAKRLLAELEEQGLTADKLPPRIVQKLKALEEQFAEGEAA